MTIAVPPDKKNLHKQRRKSANWSDRLELSSNKSLRAINISKKYKETETIDFEKFNL